MFMRVGDNGKSVCVRPEEILDIDAGLNITEFEVLSPYGSVILTAGDGLKIRCKSQDYGEFLKMIKLSRKTGATYIS